MDYIIDGKKIAQNCLAKVTTQVAYLKTKNITPKLVVVLVGNDAPSATYVRRKQLAAKQSGIDFDLIHLPEKTTEVAIIAQLKQIQADPALSGLIVQLPLPDPLYTSQVLNSIEPRFDVDCLTHENMGKLCMNHALLLPPTPAAVREIIASQGVSIMGKNVTVVGVGALVGKPLAIMLMNARASVTTVNSLTTDLAAKCRAADVIVTGVGRAGLIQGAMVKPQALVIDTGVSFVQGEMYGDAVVSEIAQHAYVTPTPGGVGPITVAKLLANTVAAAAALHKITIPEL